MCVCTLYGVSKAPVGESIHGFSLVVGEGQNELHISCCGDSWHAVWIMIAGVTQQWTFSGSVTQCLSAVVLLWLGADNLHTCTHTNTHI